MALGPSVGDAYITIHADTKKFQADVSKLSTATKDFVKDLRSLRKVTKEVSEVTDRATESNKTLLDSLTGTKEVSEVTNRAAASNKTLRDSLTGTKNESKVTRRSLFELNKLMLQFEKRPGILAGGLDKVTTRLKVTRRSLFELNKLMLQFEKRPRILAGGLDKVTTRFTRMRRSAALMEARLLRISDGFGRLTARGGVLRRTLSRLNTPFKALGRSIATSFRGMDRTVLLVLKLIAVAAPQIAALGSALSSTLVAIASSAFYALAGLTPMLGVLAPVVAGIAALAVGLQDLEKYAPGAKRALDSLTGNFKDVAVPAFFQEWGDSAANFFSVLDKFLNNPEVFASIGEAFAAITDGISGALDSGAGEALTEALTGPLSEALGVLGESLEPLLETLFNFMSASAPMAKELAELFGSWADDLNAALSSGIDDGSFQDFMWTAVDSLRIMLDFLGSIKDVLGTLFEAGVGPGNTMLQLLTGMLDEFDRWMNTIEGQNALEEWFSNGAIIMEALFKLLGAVGTAISDLITPDVIDQLVGLLDSLGIFADLLSDILAVVAEADIIGLIVLILNSLGEVIRPLLPLLSDLIVIFVTLITEALAVLTPILVKVAESLAVGLGPAIEVIIGHLPTLMEAFAPLIPVLAEILAELLLVAESLGEEFAGELDNIILVLINKGLPVLSEFLAALIPFIPILMDMVIWLLENANSIEGFVIFAISLIAIWVRMLEVGLKVIGWLKDLWDWLKAVWDWAMKLGRVIGDVLRPVMVLLLDVGLKVVGWLKTLWDWAVKVGRVIGDVLRPVMVTLLDVGLKVVGWLKDFWDWGLKVKRTIGDVVGTLWDLISALGQVSMGKLGEIAGAIGSGAGQVGEFFGFAEGGIATKPTPGVFGEAGNEALVPLDRPLSQVDPSVRALSAFAQGLHPGGSGMNIEAGAIQVVSRASDPRIVAQEVLDALPRKVQ